MIFRKKIIAGIIGAAFAMGLGSSGVTAAQQTNLLTNGSFEPPYYVQDAQNRTAPQGWHLWIGGGSPEALPHKDTPEVLDGIASWRIGQGSAIFTAAAYQQVMVTPGQALRLAAWAWVFTCQDSATSCSIADPPYRRSDATAGVALRVGLDAAGGLDPFASTVRWSALVAPYDQWVELHVSAAAQTDTVTVFLYMTQTRGMAINEVYWDKASLIVADSVSLAEATDEVPFVVPQGVRPDGSIIHIVQAGDTLWSIAYAYIDYGVTVDSIAALNEGIRPTTRYLTPGQQLMVLPPGSVDPISGQLLLPGGASTPTMTITPFGAPAPTQAVASQEPESATETAPLPLPSTATPTGTPEPTATETPIPTATLTLTPTATLEPTATPTGTPTPVPTATPLSIADLAPGLASATGTLCATVYTDANLNGAREEDETLLSGGRLALAGPSADQDIEIAGGSVCVDLAPGQYRARATPPGGYGLTTPEMLSVTLVGGRRVEIAFGAAEGYALPSAPEGDDSEPAAEVIEPGAVAPMVEVAVEPGKKDRDRSFVDRLYDNSGLVVLVVAGVVAVGGVAALLVIYRPRT
jgi:LysM repeat protein